MGCDWNRQVWVVRGVCWNRWVWGMPGLGKCVLLCGHLLFFLKDYWGVGSVGRACEQKARHSADVGSVPWCSMRLFSHAPLSLQPLTLCSPVCSHMQQHLCACYGGKNGKQWQSYCTLIKMDNVALAAAIA